MYRLPPNFVVKTLADSARFIAREGNVPPPAAPSPAASPARRTEGQITAPSGPVAHFEPPRAPAPAPPPPPPPPPSEPPAAVSAPVEPARPVPAPVPDLERHEHPPALIGANVPTSQLERGIEELVIQLRQQNRNADMRPDFSLGNMAAIIVQFLGLAMLGVGLAKLLTLKATFTVPNDLQMAILGALQAIAWIVGAVVMQGIVVALLIHTRQK